MPKKRKKSKDKTSGGKKQKQSKSKATAKLLKSKKSKKRVAAKSSKGSKSKKKKSGKKKPWGPKGPKPVDPHGGGKKKPPKKIKKKWPPKKKRPKGTPDPTPSSLLQFADFAPHVGTLYTITDLTPNADIELIEITALEPLDIPEDVTIEIRSEPFTLLFLGPPNVDIPQGNYSVTHPVMGNLTMFLTPVGEPYVDGSNVQLTLECVYS